MVASLAMAPGEAAGQAGQAAGFLERVVGSVENAGGFWTYAGFLPRSSVLTGGGTGSSKQSGMQGPGFIITLSVGTAGIDSGARRHRYRGQSPELAPAWGFHFVLAYSQLTGFHSQNGTLDLRGSVREFPRLAWFAQWHPERRLSPYAGVHMGLLQLQSVALYDTTGAYYPVQGSTWEIGVSGGFVTNVSAGTEWLGIFVEPGYTLRNFPSIDWGAQKTIPQRFPRSLRFTGWEIAAGLAFRAPPQKKDR